MHFYFSPAGQKFFNHLFAPDAATAAAQLRKSGSGAENNGERIKNRSIFDDARPDMLRIEEISTVQKTK
jgi:hypothetical protein